MNVALPLISVIVPNYNHEKYLSQRLDSIFNQTYPNFEVILLDDCSTDNSRVILSEYAKNTKVSHCIFNEQNSGNTFIQWKRGISLSKGEYIWIAESDDFCNINFLEKVIQPLLQDQEVALSYCQSNRVNENGEIIGNWKYYTKSLNETKFENDFISKGELFVENYLIFKNVIPNASAVLTRKSELISIIDFKDEISLKYCGDWLLYFKLIYKNKIAFVSDSLNSFRFHTESVIASVVKQNKRIEVIAVDFRMRELMCDFLKMNKSLNEKKILRNNQIIVRELKYEKAFILLHNKQRVRGFILLCNVFGLFLNKYKFKANLAIKAKRYFS